MTIAVSPDVTEGGARVGGVATPDAAGAAQGGARPQGGEAAPLGNDTSCASTAGQDGKEQFTEEDLRAYFQQLAELQELGYERVGLSRRIKECGTIPVVDDKVALGITRKGNLQTQGLCRCGARWCESCWSKVSKSRSEDVAAVARWAKQQGYELVMATLTASHVTEEVKRQSVSKQQAIVKQRVGDVFDRLFQAWRAVHSGRAGKALKEQRVGYIRGFELTLDSLFAEELTGAHGHFHALLVFERRVDVEAYAESLKTRWINACENRGLTVDGKKGVDVRRLVLPSEEAAINAALYLVKGEKGKDESSMNERFDAKSAGQEVTRSAYKFGRDDDRVAPEGFLREVGSLVEPPEEEREELEEFRRLQRRAYARWAGIESACAGRRWLTWSRDLRKLAGLGEEQSEEEIANSAEVVEDDQVAVVTYSEVRDSLDEIREVVAEAPAREKWETLLLCLNGFGGYTVMSQGDWDECVRRQQFSELVEVGR